MLQACNSSLHQNDSTGNGELNGELFFRHLASWHVYPWKQTNQIQGAEGGGAVGRLGRRPRKTRSTFIGSPTPRAKTTFWPPAECARSRGFSAASSCLYPAHKPPAAYQQIHKRKKERTHSSERKRTITTAARTIIKNNNYYYCSHHPAKRQPTAVQWRDTQAQGLQDQSQKIGDRTVPTLQSSHPLHPTPNKQNQGKRGWWGRKGRGGRIAFFFSPHRQHLPPRSGFLFVWGRWR